MKIFKYIGITAMILLAIFLGIGLLKPSFEYTTRIVINVPRQQCWDIMQDTTVMKDWIPGFRTVTLKSGQHNMPGAVYELVVIQDEVYIMTETILDIREPDVIAFNLDNDVMNLKYEFTFHEEENKTTIDGHYQATGNNILWRALLFLSKSYLQKSGQDQLNLLKHLTEQSQ